MKSSVVKWIGFSVVIAFTSGCGDGGTSSLGDGAPAGQLGSKLVDYAGSWQGYVEGYRFPDGSDSFRLELESNGSGQLRVGDTPIAPAPTDPEAPYPPGATSLGWGVKPDFVYPLHDTHVTNQRIQFSLDVMEPYGAYCAILSPQVDVLNSTPGNPYYSCKTNEGIDSFRENECILACACDQSTCTRVPSVLSEAFDGALESDGSELRGTFILGQRSTVRLQRL